MQHLLHHLGEVGLAPSQPTQHMARAWEHFPGASVSLKVRKMSGKAHVMGA